MGRCGAAPKVWLVTACLGGLSVPGHDLVLVIPSGVSGTRLYEAYLRVPDPGAAVQLVPQEQYHACSSLVSTATAPLD